MVTRSPMHVSTQEALLFWQRVNQRGLENLPYDLSARQTAILLRVYLTSPPHTIRNLAERLGISKPAICRAVDTLSMLELLKRKKDEDDKRNVFIQRTVAGSVYLSDFAEIIAQELREPCAKATIPSKKELAHAI